MRQPRFESHGTSSAAPANGQSEIEVRAKIATKLYSSKHVIECILTQYPHDNMVLARAVEIVGENEIVGLESSMPDTHTELVKLSVVKLRKKDGSVCTTAEEAAEARKGHFVLLFGKEPKYNPTARNYIDQLPVREAGGETPTEEDVVKAVRALKCTGPGLEGVHAAAMKVIVSNDILRGIVVKSVVDFWESGVVPSSWESCLLKILPKPGDQSLASNCRGIMLLEVVYKVVGNILKERIMVVSESLGLDHVGVAWMRYSTSKLR